MKTGINQIVTKSLLAMGFFGILTTGAHAAYFDAAPAPRCAVALTRQLKFGSEGVDVSVLQDFLNRGGYLSTVPNGYYGPATTAAVRAFQYQNYIPVTGQVGSLTLNAINERMCDTDLHADSSSDSYVGGYDSIQTGVTYVDTIDPFVHVITPQSTTPVVYTNPQNAITNTAYTTVNPSTVISPSTTNGTLGTTIVYSPSIGYTYGVTPTPGVLTIISPQANVTYREGDTVTLAWTTNNLPAAGFTVLLENTSTNQSRTITSTGANTASFVLTKELLDAVCSGVCTTTNQDNYRIVITTPVRDIAGNVSTLRAAVQPVTVLRPFNAIGSVTLTASKTPVSSGELFRLYASIPFLVGVTTINNQYSFRLRAICPAGVTASIAGAVCGQDFTVPYNSSYFQSDIPASVVNTTFFPQNVPFVLTAFDAQGQVLGFATTTVQVNAAPFSW